MDHIVDRAGIRTTVGGGLDREPDASAYRRCRVQVYSSNQQQTAKTEALELEEKLKAKIEQTIYVQYLPPFWKVRLGDFRTYNEAKQYKKEFVEMFPQMMGDTYIVRDKIQVLQ